MVSFSPSAYSAYAPAYSPASGVAPMGQPPGRPRIGEILGQAGWVTPQDVNAAVAMARMNGIRTGEALMQMGKINPDQLYGALNYQQQWMAQNRVNIPQPSNGVVNFTPVPAPPPPPSNPMLDAHIISQALSRVGQIRHLPNDDAYVRHMGVQPVFQNGAQALQLILSRGIRVEFGDMGDSAAHAQWIQDQNLIMINQRYRGDASPATIYAIAEAIYHEAGHAAGNGDNQSSIQEELNCLSLNTLAHRYHEAIDPAYAQTVSSSRLISDGVALYAKLFFDPDPFKRALVNRVVQKYGDLPMWSPGHPVPPPTQPKPLAYRVAEQVDANNVAAGLMPSSYALSQTAGFAMPAIPQPAAAAPRLNMVA